MIKTYNYSVVIMLLVLLLVGSVQAQVVKKRINDFILIDTDTGLGSVGDTVSIFRILGKEIVEAGTVKIVKFSRGMTVAAVISETDGPVKTHDIVDSPKTRSLIHSFSKKLVPSGGVHRVILRNQGVALIEGGRALGSEGDVLEISRRLNDTILDVGRVKIVKFTDNRAAVEIVREYGPYRITKNDVVKPVSGRGKEDDHMDVDYFYYGRFR